MKISEIVKKGILYVSIAAILLSVGLFVHTLKKVDEGADYTSFSTRPKGLKALYLLTGQMGYDVSRYKKSARFLPDASAMIAVNPDLSIYNGKREKKYLIEWIKRGNTLIIFGNENDIGQFGLDEFNGNMADLPSKVPYLNFVIEKGDMIFVKDFDRYTNSGLRDREYGVAFIELLDRTGKKNILFNEYYHGIQEEGFIFLDIVGPTGKVLVIQVFIGLVILLFIGAGRFGKPVTVYETVKRKENENLFALANIYIKGRAHAAVMENCLNYFKRDLSRYLGLGQNASDDEIFKAASLERVLKNTGLKELISSCREFINQEKKDAKLLLGLTGKLEKIRKEIK